MKQTVEKAFEESWVNDYYHGNYKGHARIGFYAGAEWQAKQSPWISVKDEYPSYDKDIPLDEREQYIVRAIAGSVVTEEFYTLSHLIYPQKFAVETDWVRVTHWMPIPKYETNK